MIGVSPIYLADTLRRIEARRAAIRPKPKIKPKPEPPKVVGYYGTVGTVDSVDRRPRGNDPDAVNRAVGNIVQDYIEPAENEVEDPTFGNEKLLRGIPAVGRVGGVIFGTRPGDDPRRLDD